MFVWENSTTSALSTLSRKAYLRTGVFTILKYSDQSVWHQQPQQVSTSLKSPSLLILMLCLSCCRVTDHICVNKQLNTLLGIPNKVATHYVEIILFDHKY